MNGKTLRQSVPRSEHSLWARPPARMSAVDIVTSQNTDRVGWLVPVRHWRMSESPFTFFRGAAAAMAEDLSLSPSTGIDVQLCGDAHLSNFGFYGAPDRSLVFDLNDFDETLPGPWEWDIKRLAASAAIAARANGLHREDQEALARVATEAYRQAIRKFASMGYLDLWYSRLDEKALRDALGSQLSKKDRKEARRTTKKARKRDSRHALGKLATKTDDGYRIVHKPPLIIPLRFLDEVAEAEVIRQGLAQAVSKYLDSVSDQMQILLRRFALEDFAVKVVGVGSVGTRCFIGLLRGRDDDDPLFLQIKQAGLSVLEHHLPPSEYRNSGQRVVEGQRLMQAASDIFLGWTDVDESGHHYYWRQLRDMKASVEVEDMSAERLASYLRACGWTLARAHSRSIDPKPIADYLGKSDVFDRALAAFSLSYADQNDEDYQDFVDAIGANEIEAHPNPTINPR